MPDKPTPETNAALIAALAESMTSMKATLRWGIGIVVTVILGVTGGAAGWANSIEDNLTALRISVSSIQRTDSEVDRLRGQVERLQEIVFTIMARQQEKRSVE